MNMTKNTLEDLGKKIREAREQRGISQADLAQLIEKDQRSVSQLENGKRPISAVELLQLSKLLDVSLLFFYEGDLDTNDIDRLMMEQLERLPNETTRRTAVELVRVFCDAIENERKV